MDEGDEYVPQISQMDYNLMGEMGGAGVGTGLGGGVNAASLYDPSMQMYGTTPDVSGVTPVANVPSAALISQQQRYAASANFHHQQMLQSQKNAQQQRLYMSQQVPSGMAANQQQMYQMGVPHGSGIEMNPAMNRLPTAHGSASAMPSQQMAASAQAQKQTGKQKNTRKSKKAFADAAASESATVASATVTPNKQPMVDPRGFPLSAQQPLPPAYQTPSFNHAMYQQHQQAAFAMQQKYLYMQQQQQQAQAGQQQQQQPAPWITDPTINPAYASSVAHHQQQAAQQNAAAHQSGFHPGQIPPASAAMSFHTPGYSNNGMPANPQAAMNPASGYYSNMKPPFADQQQQQQASAAAGGYGMTYGNIPTSSAAQQASRFPTSSSYMSATADTPGVSSAATVAPMQNVPPVPSSGMMHPYYPPQQSQQHFPHLPYNTNNTVQPSSGGPIAKPPHMQQHPQQSSQMNSSTSTTMVTQVPVTSAMMSHFSAPHQQQAPLQPQGKDAMSHGQQLPNSQQPQHWAPGMTNTPGMTGTFGEQPQPSQPMASVSTYQQQQTTPSVPPAQASQQMMASGQQMAPSGAVVMQHQQLQQINMELQRLHREIYECESQANFLQQQPRTPEVTQRIEQLKQQSLYGRTQFASLQQKHTYIMSTINALNEQHKQQAMLPGGNIPSVNQKPGAQPGLNIMHMTSMNQVGQQAMPLTGHNVPAQMVSPSMDQKFAGQQQQPQSRQLLTSPTTTNTSQVSPTGFKKPMEFDVSSASSIPPSSSFSVMQTSANQVQVNITPEPTGRTLISVYHQQYPMAAPIQEQSNLATTASAMTTTASTNEYSIPPEPVPPKRQRTGSLDDGTSVSKNSYIQNNTTPSSFNSATSLTNMVATTSALNYEADSAVKQTSLIGEPTRIGHSPPPMVPKSQQSAWEAIAQQSQQITTAPTTCANNVVSNSISSVATDSNITISASFSGSSQKSPARGMIVTTSITTLVTSSSSFTTTATAKESSSNSVEDLKHVVDSSAELIKNVTEEQVYDRTASQNSSRSLTECDNAYSIVNNSEPPPGPKMINSNEEPIEDISDDVVEEYYDPLKKSTRPTQEKDDINERESETLLELSTAVTENSKAAPVLAPGNRAKNPDLDVNKSEDVEIAEESKGDINVTDGESTKGDDVEKLTKEANEIGETAEIEKQYVEENDERQEETEEISESPLPMETENEDETVNSIEIAEDESRIEQPLIQQDLIITPVGDSLNDEIVADEEQPEPSASKTTTPSPLPVRSTKKKGRKPKIAEVMDKEPPATLDDFIVEKVDKKKKKKSSKDRSRDRKSTSSRKRKRTADANLPSGDEDEEDAEFVLKHKKKKISKASIAKELDVPEENLDEFVEKRRSGRKKVNKNYEDKEIEIDMDDMVIDEPSSNRSERQSSSGKGSGATNDDNTSTALADDTSQLPDAPQEEWIVEKILGYRMAKRKIRKKNVDSKATLDSKESSAEVKTELEENDGGEIVDEKKENKATLAEPEKESEKSVSAENGTGVSSPKETEEGDNTDEAAKEDKISIEAANIESTEDNIDQSDKDKEAKDEDESVSKDAEGNKTPEVPIKSTMKEAEKTEESAENNDENPAGAGDEEDEEEAEQFYVKYKNRSYIHCEWKFADELEAMDKRAAGKISRYKLKYADMLNDEEYFNEDYVIVDRVLDDLYDEDENEHYAYVKWRSLPYGECSWENVKDVPQSKIDASHKRNLVIDTYKMKDQPRPSAKEWKKISSGKVFKDGNTLREYQVEGVNWLLFCYFNKQNCILADEMGLGKTVQTITFLQGVYDLGIHGPFLIVVPLSTLHNWEREFETWTDMNAVVYHGSASSRQIIQDYELYYSKSVRGESKKKQVIKFDALITTFEMVVSDCEVLRKINYRVCVIDEAHRLKNRNCKLLTGGLGAFKMEHRVLLTGTPLQNNIQELYSLLNFLEPEQFSSSESFLEQFGQCQTEEQVQKLQEILKPMMLRRLKEDVEKTLQPKEETIIEVQLSNIQKKYYRAILERNFTHLIKGGSMPSLMNTMMELRKCCNHPFLINGAEEQIMSEVRTSNPECESEEQLQAIGLIQSSGKLVLIDKLLPKLRQDGHKVLIFSQMVRVLDLIEEFLVYKSYPFERIDGNVRGDLRQAAIDRFSRQDTERFVFLLCTRAGGLGINLTAADTVIIFDSDWNPQNDLQAQARCHRIGQTKMVKVYRLITSNTYEREMFDKASLKLGLDKAVLQSMAPRDSSQQLTRKEVEDLLRKGAYGAVMEEDNEGSKFSEEDIETILQRRTQTIKLEPGIKGSTFAKASFTSSDNREDIDINDPNFWAKWAKKVNIDVDAVLTTKKLANDENLILLEPRSRRKRFEENYKASDSADESALASAEDDSEGVNGNASTSKNGDDAASSTPSKKSGIATWKKKRRAAGTLALAHEDGDEDYVGVASGYTPNELAFNKSEFFKVEKLLGAWGWGRWSFVKQKTDIALSENDMEHISRTLLLYCVREFRGDEKTREFVWNLIKPHGGVVCKNSEKSDFSGGIYHEGWAALPEYNPPSFAVDLSFQRHVHRHANKLLARIYHLHFLQTNVIGTKNAAIAEDKMSHADAQLQLPNAGDPPQPNWDIQCDKSFLLGIYKHGMENYEAIRQDPKLCFIEKGITEMPSTVDLNARFKRLVSMLQRQVEVAAMATISWENMDCPNLIRWPKVEEADYMNTLRSYGVKDHGTISNAIDWDGFRERSTLLKNKTDDEMLQQLYCILAMCTKVQGGDLSAVDSKRADCVEQLTGPRAMKLMNRVHLMRKVHAVCLSGLQSVEKSLKLCPMDIMPKNWTEEHDRALLTIVDKHGLDGISSQLANLPLFQKIQIEEKILLRRVMELCTTMETGRWNGTASIELLDDDDTTNVNRYIFQTGSGSRASSDSPGPVRGRGGSRRAVQQQSQQASSSPAPSRNSQKNAASGKSGKSGNAGGTANITNVTSLDLAELEKEKMKSLMQQHQSLMKMDQASANYMMSLLGLAGSLPSTSASSSSKSTTTTAASSSSSLSSSAMQMQAALLAMSTAFGVSDAATASALASMLTGIPMSSLLAGTSTTATSTSATSKTATTTNVTSTDDVLNLSKRKTGNVSASLNFNTSSAGNAGLSKSGKTSILNPINTRTTASTSTSSSKIVTASETKTTNMASTSAGSQGSTSAAANNKVANIGMAELLAISNFPPDFVIPVVHVDTNVAPAADKMPKLKNLNDWLAAHPKYTIDLIKLLRIPTDQITPTTSTRPKAKDSAALNLSSSEATSSIIGAGGSITTGGSARSAANKLLSNAAASNNSRVQSPANSRTTPSATAISTSAGATYQHTNVSSASKTPTSSSQISASTAAKMANDLSSLAGLESLFQIGVFKKSTGAALPQEKWPLPNELAKWLDKNPDYNVQNSYAAISKAILPKSYHNRLGGDFAGSASLSSASTANPTTSTAALNSAAAASLVQSLSSVFPSTSAASSSAALTQLLAAAANPLSFNSSSMSQTPSSATSILNSNSGSQMQSTTSASSTAATNLSMQNMETLQMQLLLQQLMLSPSMMTGYNPYTLLGGSSTVNTSTSNNTGNSTSLNNLAANLSANSLLGSASSAAGSTSNSNSSNAASNDALMAALLGLGGSAADQMTATLLTQALSGITPTSGISTSSANNLSTGGGNKANTSHSALTSLTSALAPVNSSISSNNSASNLIAEAALAAEILTNPSLMTSMLNPLGSLAGVSNTLCASNNSSNNKAVTSSANSSTSFMNALTSPALPSTSSIAGIDAATMATLAATFGGIDAATLAALTGTAPLSQAASLIATPSRKPTTASSSATTATVATSSGTGTHTKRVKLDAVVKKLVNSSNAASMSTSTNAISNSSNSEAAADEATVNEPAEDAKN